MASDHHNYVTWRRSLADLDQLAAVAAADARLSADQLEQLAGDVLEVWEQLREGARQRRLGRSVNQRQLEL